MVSRFHSKCIACEVVPCTLTSALAKFWEMVDGSGVTPWWLLRDNIRGLGANQANLWSIAEQPRGRGRGAWPVACPP